MFLDYKKKMIVVVIGVLFFSIISSFYLQLHHAKQQETYSSGIGIKPGFEHITIAKFTYGYPLVFSQIDLRSVEIPIEEATNLSKGVNNNPISLRPFLFDISVTTSIFFLSFAILFYFSLRVYRIFLNKKTFWYILVITFLLAFYQVYIAGLYYELPLTIFSMITPLLPLITISRILLSFLPGNWIGSYGYFFLYYDFGFTLSATNYIFFILIFITNFIFFSLFKLTMDKVRKRKSSQKTN